MSDLNQSDCKRYAVDLSAYFDRELDQPRTEEVEKHLTRCPPCRGDLALMGRVSQLLSAQKYRQRPNSSLSRDLQSQLDEIDAEMGRS